MGRYKILQSMCPQIRGMPFVKLAALMMLIGGVPRKDDSGTSIRGQIHMLIVGDPGTGTGSTKEHRAAGRDCLRGCRLAWKGLSFFPCLVFARMVK